MLVFRKILQMHLMHDPIQSDIAQVFSIKTLSFALGLVASVEVKLLNGNSSDELFEGRTITLGCVDNTTIETFTVWYKNDMMINNTTTRNLTLTLKSSDTGFYKCGINETNSTNKINVAVKGMNFGVL